VGVIVAGGPLLPALKQATSTIPVVMAGSSDPVGLGYVQSLRRPGGNFTGLSVHSVELIGKRLELLKLAPGAAPVAVLRDRASSLLNWQAAEVAARERGWKLLSLEIRDAGEIEGPSRRQLARAPAPCSCFRAGSSTGMPGDSRSWLPRAVSPPCIHSGSMSRPAV
jgi:putative ABC transport system substrate-binding protein